MNDTILATRLKALRKQRAMSQEALAEESKLSLRTIQRIENGQSNPTGDTLKRLANALNVSPDELIDWSIKEDNNYLVFLNLSALTFILFPLLGILVPFMLWVSRKGKIKNIDPLARDLVNFQINWNLLLFMVPVVLFLLSWANIISEISLSMLITAAAVLYSINILFIGVNTVLISNKKSARYFYLVRFIR